MVGLGSALANYKYKITFIFVPLKSGCYNYNINHGAETLGIAFILKQDE